MLLLSSSMGCQNKVQDRSASTGISHTLPSESTGMAKGRNESTEVPIYASSLQLSHVVLHALTTRMHAIRWVCTASQWQSSHDPNDSMTVRRSQQQQHHR